MANRYANPVMFALENNPVFLSCHVTFNGAGIPTLDTQNSKGICNFAIDSIPFNANSVGSSVTLSSVTSFAGLYPGMTLTGNFGTGTIASITAASGLITLTSGTGVVTTNGALVNANGGRYRVQFGTQAGVRLDTYYKFLTAQPLWCENFSSASGAATVQALAPAAGNMFVAQINSKVKTIPRTATSGSTDASLVLQFGNFQSGAGQNFIAKAPAAGEALRVFFVFVNSSAQ